MPNSLDFDKLVQILVMQTIFLLSFKPFLYFFILHFFIQPYFVKLIQWVRLFVLVRFSQFEYFFVALVIIFPTEVEHLQVPFIWKFKNSFILDELQPTLLFQCFFTINFQHREAH